MANNKALDDLQLEALDAYDNGEFAYLKEHTSKDAIGYSLENGDTLLTFILKELSDAKGDRQEAIRMMYRAGNQLHSLAAHFE